MVEALKCYKILCEYQNTDFDADKTNQYIQLRKEMTKKFEGFGPLEPIRFKKNDMLTKEEKKEQNKQTKECDKQIERGYNRVQSKIKQLRQGFSKALISGSRSGSHNNVNASFLSAERHLWFGDR